MAVGSPLFRLVRANAVCTIQAGTATTSGGTQITWSSLKSGVDLALSNVAGSRAFNAGTFNERGTCDASGLDPLLSRPDVRLLVTSAAEGLTWLVGLYLSIVSSTTHPRGSGGLVQARVALRCTVLEVPGDDGAEL